MAHHLVQLNIKINKVDFVFFPYSWHHLSSHATWVQDGAHTTRKMYRSNLLLIDRNFTSMFSQLISGGRGRRVCHCGGIVAVTTTFSVNLSSSTSKFFICMNACEGKRMDLKAWKWFECTNPAVERLVFLWGDTPVRGLCVIREAVKNNGSWKKLR